MRVEGRDQYRQDKLKPWKQYVPDLKECPLMICGAVACAYSYNFGGFEFIIFSLEINKKI